MYRTVTKAKLDKIANFAFFGSPTMWLMLQLYSYPKNPNIAIGIVLKTEVRSKTEIWKPLNFRKNGARQMAINIGANFAKTRVL